MGPDSRPRRDIIPAEDPALGDALAEYLRADGVKIYTGVHVELVCRDANGFAADFHTGDQSATLRAEQLLVAIGRRPNTPGLGLDAIGVTLGGKGEIAVDEFLQTARSGVYAAGDVLGEPMLVYVAAYGGTVAAENALNGNTRRYDLSALPRVTFTDPAVAAVGITDAEARSRGMEPLVVQLSLEHVPRALAARDTRGFVKLVADAASRKLIGAQILAAEAGEMITESALAIRFSLTIEDLTSTFHPYLTLSEGIKLAAQAFTMDVAKLSANGDRVILIGTGTLGLHPKFATGGGSFTHTTAGGNVLVTGTFTATELLSFEAYGPSPLLPPTLSSGQALLRVVLLPEGSTTSIDAILRIECALPGSTFPGGKAEGINLLVPGIANFNQQVSGATVFVRIE